MKAVYVYLVVISLWMILACNSGDTEPESWMPELLNEASGSGVYLPDFSYAGYRWGESGLPEFAGTVDVGAFGAIPNDGQDDTDAILNAVAAAHRQSGMAVVKFPAGRFILKKYLFIERSDFVLQGSGSGEDGTILYLPVPMKEMPLPEGLVDLNEYLVRYDKRVKSGELFSPFSWTGGIIWPRIKQKQIYPYLEEKDREAVILTRVNGGKRGGKQFSADSTAALKVGDLVKILWFNREGEKSSLVRHMYGEGNLNIGSRHWEYPGRPLIQQIVTVVAIDNHLISIKEPLLHDLRSEWNCSLAPAEVLTGVGIEHLRIEFPELPYGGHHLEHGYNAIYLTSLAHSWVRDLHFVNADNAILSDDCANVTIEDVGFSGRRTHYTVHVGKVNHFLVKRLTINCAAEHSLSFNTFSKASVFTDAEILLTPTLDQHCGTNHQNLFDNIRIVETSPQPDLFQHGGAGYWKPTHGRFNTFWNIQITFDFQNPGTDTIRIKSIDNAPSARFVGFSANYPVRLDYGPDAYFEGINRGGIGVTSLYEYQLQQRLMK